MGPGLTFVFHEIAFVKGLCKASRKQPALVVADVECPISARSRKITVVQPKNLAQARIRMQKAANNGGDEAKQWLKKD
jgi:hypothetical protein